jgi:hypothetical protein
LGAAVRRVLSRSRKEIMSLLEALVMLGVILLLAIGIAFVRSPRLKNWGVFAIFVLVSIPPGAVIVNSLLAVFGL